MSDSKIMKLVNDKQSYLSSFIDEDNTDIIANTKSRKGLPLKVEFIPEQSWFNITRGSENVQVLINSNHSEVSNLTVTSTGRDEVVFAYQHKVRNDDVFYFTCVFWKEEHKTWYTTTKKGSSPLLVTDELRDNLLHQANVILYFINENNQLCHVSGINDFNTVVVNTQLRRDEKLVKVGITKGNRLQLLTTRPVGEIVYSALLGNKGKPILDKNRNPIWVGKQQPLV